MKLKTVRKLNKKISVVSVIAVLSIIAVVALSGFLYAKYIKKMPYDGNVTVSAKLATSIELYENVAEKQLDGSYKLTGVRTDANQYIVLPGLDIPKNPTIEIIGKTNIPAYLYIEVLDELDADKENNINYSLTENWTLLSGAAPKTTGAQVYVYSVGGTPVVFNGTIADYNIEIIEGNTLYVSQYVDHNTDVSLSFYAYMFQQDGGNAASTGDATRVFNNN